MRYTKRWGAVVLAALFLGAPGSWAQGGAQTTGVPVGVTLAAGDTVDEVTVVVLRGWLNSETFRLEVSVTELTSTGDLVDHGTVVVPVSSAALFGSDKGEAVLGVPFPGMTAVLVNSTLRPCVQVLIDTGQGLEEFGEIQCNSFGPF